MTTAKEHMLSKMSEAELQGMAIQLAEVLHLQYHHETDSRRSRKGFPDCVFAGPHGVVWVEFKNAKYKVSPEQQAWIDMLVSSGQTAYVARPADWSKVEADLLRIAGRSRLT